MFVDAKYKTSAIAVGGRDGRTRTEDGELDLQLAVPREIGGPGGEGTNPEQLFAAGYAACFLGAMKVAGQQRIGTKFRMRRRGLTSTRTSKATPGPGDAG